MVHPCMCVLPCRCCSNVALPRGIQATADWRRWAPHAALLGVRALHFASTAAIAGCRHTTNACLSSGPSPGCLEAAGPPPATTHHPNRPHSRAPVNLPQVESGSGRVQFDKVVAFKRDGEYFRGRPYLEDVVVEAQLVEEFTAGASVDVVQPMLGKVLVTRIAHTEATRRALEEAFSHSV